MKYVFEKFRKYCVKKPVCCRSIFVVKQNLQNSKIDAELSGAQNVLSASAFNFLKSSTLTDINPLIYYFYQVQSSSGDRTHVLRLKSTTNQEPLGPCISYIPMDHIEKQKILSLREDERDFLISLPDFLKTFTQIEVVHLDADTARDEPTLNGKNPWTLR